jgi:PAS domain S-box-containing protein
MAPVAPSREPLAPPGVNHDARYRVFVQQTLDAVYIYDAETKAIVETNPAFQELMGYSEPETLKLSVYDILAHDRVSVTGYFQEIMASERSTRAERQWRRKDGSLLDVQVTASVIREGDRQLVAVLGRDITERKNAEAALRRAERRYRDLFDEAPAMYVVTQERDHIPVVVDCNQLFLRTLGYEREQVVGRPLADFYTQTSQLRTLPPETLAHEGRDLPEERHLMTRDGRLVHTLMRTTPELDLKGHVVGTRAMYMDMTERKRIEAELRAGAALNDLAQMAASALDLHSTVQLLADQLGELMLADACYVALWDEVRSRPVPTAAYGPLREVYTAITFPSGQRTLTESVVTEGRTLVVEDASSSAHLSPAVAKRFSLQSVLGLPLVAGDRRLGAALVAFHQRHRFTPEEVAFAERAAGPIALALAKAKFFEELQASHARLAEAYDATLEGLALALELRDKETEGHTRRVTDMTVRLARAMGVPDDDLIHIRRGALLHDIGKIGIPDDILRKPGPLTPSELTIMRRHPSYAYEIISAIPFLHPAIDIPYCHHEKWDGTGYPRGLQDEAIPLAARIFAIVDVWDALRSDRPYRESWPSDKVVDHIRLLSGSHFDPRVVEPFLSLLEAEGLDS